MNNINIQKSIKLFLIIEFIFYKDTGLQIFKFLNIILVKGRDNIIHIKKDNDLAIYKTAKFFKNKIKV